jgi:hypothetical protein
MDEQTEITAIVERLVHAQINQEVATISAAMYAEHAALCAEFHGASTKRQTQIDAIFAAAYDKRVARREFALRRMMLPVISRQFARGDVVRIAKLREEMLAPPAPAPAVPPPAVRAPRPTKECQPAHKRRTPTMAQLQKRAQRMQEEAQRKRAEEARIWLAASMRERNSLPRG